MKKDVISKNMKDFSQKIRKSFGFIILSILSIIYFPKNLMMRLLCKKRDVVFILYSKSSLKRLRKLINFISRDFKVKCFCISKLKIILRGWMWPTKSFLPKDFIFRYVYFVYRPKIVIVQHDMLHPNLKLFLNKKGVKLINLAHAFTANNELFPSLNYDYYFIYGEKSLQNIMSNPYAKGSTKVILAGSPFYDVTDVELSDNRDYVLIVGSYFHEYYLKYEKAYEYFEKFYEILSEFISAHQEIKFLYKPHFRREIKLEKKYILCNKNVYLERETNIYKVISKSKLVICDNSFTSVDAACLGVPFIVFDWTYNIFNEFKDFGLSDLNFFERAKDKETLLKLYKKRVNTTEDIVKKLYDYANLHIKVKNSIEFIAERIKDIYFNRLDHKWYVEVVK